MGLDEALSAVGQFGRWQIIHYIFIAASFGLTCAWQLFAIVFIGYVDEHHCKLPANTSVDLAVPLEEDPGGELRYAQCVMYDLNSTGLNETIKCPDGWQYNSLYFTDAKGTMVTEWDLVCDRDGDVELSLTVFNCGVVVGVLLFTPLGDKFGRKNIFFLGQLAMNVFGIAMSFSPNFTSFCIFQFLTGGFAGGLYMEGGVLAVEMFPTDLRTFLAPITPMFGSAGLALLALWGYYFRLWRDLQLVISATGCVFLLYFFFCPESLRWLVATGQIKEAKRILKQVARVNGGHLPEGVLEAPSAKQQEEKSKEGTPGEGKTSGQLLFQLFRRPRSLRYMVIMMYLLFVNNVMYYGLSLMQGSLSGDFYVNFAVNGVLEIPALIVSILAMAKWGRRYPLAFFQMFAAVFMALSSAATVFPVSDSIDRGLLVTGLALVSKFGVAGAYGVMVIYATEIVPTSIRSTCLGIQAGFGSLGSLAAPYLAVFLLRIEYWIPGAIFACLASVASLLTLLEPETIGRPLPDTVEEIEAWTLTLTKEEIEARKEKTFRKVWAGISNPAYVPDGEPGKDDVGKSKSSKEQTGITEGRNGHIQEEEDTARDKAVVSPSDVDTSDHVISSF